MPLHSEEHIRLLKSLIRNEVKFLLIGGHAAIYYGVNRNTGDLDILIEPTRENGSRLIKALLEIGLEIPEIKPEEFEKELVLGFGFEPDAVDILNFTPGLDFTVTYQNSNMVDFEGLSIRVIDIRDLIKNKENLNRKGEKALMDKYDAEVLKKILKQKKD
jgi:hypothetical protein